MDKELTQLKRRPFMFPLVLPIAVVAVLLVAAVWFWDMRGTTIAIVVRHAEAEAGSDLDPNLSLLGQERAARLARALAQVQGERGADAIFASEMRRTQQTVAPLAQSLSLPTNILPAASWSDLHRRILSDYRGKVVVVAGHSNTVPLLIDALSGQSVTLSESEYDRLFIVFIPRIARTRVLQLRY